MRFFWEAGRVPSGVGGFRRGSAVGLPFSAGPRGVQAAPAVVATPWADGRLKISECARPGACVSSARSGPASVVGSFGRFGQVGEGGAVDVLGDVQALGDAAAEFGDVADESDGAVVGA